MKIYVPLGVKINLGSFLRQNGYAWVVDYETNRNSFIKRLTSDDYPRFHIYLERDLNGRNYFNLHLDQKEPSYPQAPAHSAEYNGEVVTREGNYLKRRLYNLINYSEKPKETKSFLNWLKKIF